MIDHIKIFVNSNDYIKEQNYLLIYTSFLLGMF